MSLALPHRQKFKMSRWRDDDPAKGTEIVWAFDPTAARRMLVDAVCLNAQEDETCRAGKFQRGFWRAQCKLVYPKDLVSRAFYRRPVAREVALAASQRWKPGKIARVFGDKKLIIQFA